jgi:tRNA threonylcarbamoyladenosine biosynthesis protein TsaE
MEIITNSASETQKLGEKIAASLKTGTVLALFGDLGSGKTTFMQGLAVGLGIKDRILSPTFVLMRQYQILNTKYEILNLYHIDLYRIENERDTQSLGLQELWSDPTNIVAIEWPEKIAGILPKNRIEIYFEYLGEERRKIKVISNLQFEL